MAEPVCSTCAAIRFIRVRGCAVAARAEKPLPCVFCDGVTYGRAELSETLRAELLREKERPPNG